MRFGLRGLTNKVKPTTGIPTSLTHFRVSARDPIMIMRTISIVSILVVSSWTAGCAALDANSAIADGETALQAAKAQQAPEYARYAYKKADLLLNAAKERNGYGEYLIAQQWAATAKSLAKEAEQTAKARKNLEAQKKRIKKASESLKRKRLTPPKPNSPAEKAVVAPPKKPATKRRKLLPPSRPSRRLLPPKRSGEDLP